MNITINRNTFRDALAVAGRAVATRSTLPLLTHILLEAGENGLTLRATDFELGIETTAPAAVETHGALTLPARTLTDVIGALPDGPVSMEADDNNVVAVRAGRSHYTLRGLPARDFPALPAVDAEPLTLPAETLRQLAARTLFAVSTDETRALLTGVLVTLADGVLKLVATDTHRLAVAEAPCEGQDVQVIVPAKALREACRLPGDALCMALTASQARFDGEGTTLVTRLIDGQFPNFERVIPREWQRRVECQREDLEAAIRRALAICARDGANRVVFRTEYRRLTLTTESGEVGRAQEWVECDCEGDDVEIAFNGRYLLDALAATDAERVALEMTGSLNPASLRVPDTEEWLCVLMPMAVQ